MRPIRQTSHLAWLPSIWSSLLLAVSRPFVIWLINHVSLYAILAIRYVIVIPTSDKEMGSCSDGWGKCVEVRGPPSRKWDNARSFHRSFPVQAATLLRPQDSRAPGRGKSLRPFTWGDSWCAIRESSDSSLFGRRMQYLRRWSNARLSFWRTELNASALATTR